MQSGPLDSRVVDRASPCRLLIWRIATWAAPLSALLPLRRQAHVVQTFINRRCCCHASHERRQFSHRLFCMGLQTRPPTFAPMRLLQYHPPLLLKSHHFFASLHSLLQGPPPYILHGPPSALIGTGSRGCPAEFMWDALLNVCGMPC